MPKMKVYPEMLMKTKERVKQVLGFRCQASENAWPEFWVSMAKSKFKIQEVERIGCMTGYPQKYLKTMRQPPGKLAFVDRNAVGRGLSESNWSRTQHGRSFCPPSDDSSLLLSRNEGESGDLHENRGQGKNEE